MRERRSQSGQVMPMVALMMVVILGMAAFALDGSNLYSQHRRLQADLDVAIKVAGSEMFDFNPSDASYATVATQAITAAATLLAQDGYANNIATATYPGPYFTYVNGTNLSAGICGNDTGPGGSGIKICNPPQSGNYVGRFDYIEGTMSRDVGGFFGGVIGLGKLRVSVRAVAWHGGYHNPYAIIGLKPNDCSIFVNDASASLWVHGSIMANGWTCDKAGGTAQVDGHSDEHEKTAPPQGSVITGTTGTNSGVPQIVDPNNPITFTATAPITTVSSGSFPSQCAAEVSYYLGALTPAANATYYFAPDPANGKPGLVTPSPFTATGNSYYFLPFCDGSQKGQPGAFYFSGSNYDMHLSGTPTFTSWNTVLLFDNNASKAEIKDDGQAIWSLHAPTSGVYQGIAVSDHLTDPVNCNGSYPLLELTGNAGSVIDGTVDAPCANVVITGNSTGNFIDGLAVGWTVNIQGHGQTVVTYDPSGLPPDKGSVLVE